jgi:hypothetical protein
MLRKNCVVIAAALGSLCLLGGASAFARDPVFPYSPNETGEYVVAKAIAPPMSTGRLDNPSPIRELPSARDEKSVPLSGFPYSPNETGEYVARS